MGVSRVMKAKELGGVREERRTKSGKRGEGRDGIYGILRSIFRCNRRGSLNHSVDGRVII